MRRHPSSPRSIAAYLAAKELDAHDRAQIAMITKPKGWIEKSENIENLDEDELMVRQSILDRIKKFPPIKVTLFKFRRLLISKLNSLSLDQSSVF